MTAFCRGCDKVVPLENYSLSKDRCRTCLEKAGIRKKSQ